MHGTVNRGLGQEPYTPAVIAFAGVEAEGIVQGGALAAALAVVPLLAEVVGVGVDTQEAHQGIQLPDSVLHTCPLVRIVLQR